MYLYLKVICEQLSKSILEGVDKFIVMLKMYASLINFLHDFYYYLNVPEINKVDLIYYSAPCMSSSTVNYDAIEFMVNSYHLMACFSHELQSSN